MKIYTNELGHMTNMAAMPIYGKNLKKSSSPEPIDLWLMTYAKVKFDHIGFYMGKGENYFFFLETIAALGLKLLEAFS